MDGINLPRCMQMITPDNVIEAVRKCLTNQQCVTESPSVELPKLYRVTDLKQLPADGWCIFSSKELDCGLLENVQLDALGVEAIGCWYKNADGTFSPDPRLFGARLEHVQKALASGVCDVNGLGNFLGTYLRKEDLTWRDVGRYIIKMGC